MAISRAAPPEGLEAATPKHRIVGEAADRHLVEMMLVSGGDERIAIDPTTRRNRYGTPRGQARDEIWLSSSTASAISSRGYAAASAAFRSLMGRQASAALPAWFEGLRARLVALFGIPGTEAVLSASGTEAELLTLVLARCVLRHPLTNVVLAPKETGSGVSMAAGGRHFLDSAPFASAVVTRGTKLEGWEDREIAVAAIDIRDPQGVALAAGRIDDAVRAAVETILADGRDALVHVLDCSKTGRSGLRRSTAAALLAHYAGRLQVVVDACQLRCSPEQIRADLAAGFMVMITGSKFAGGPPFAGALLLPPALVGHLEAVTPPRGLAAYSAAHDWPLRFAPRLQERFTAPANIGLGLRWEAALAELEGLAALDRALRARIVARFGMLVEAHIAGSAGLERVDREAPDDHAGARTIVPVLAFGRGAVPIPADRLHRALRDRARTTSSGNPARVFHLGQPVAVGDRTALRICLSAVHMVDIGNRIRAGQDFDLAFDPLAADLHDLFTAWDRLRENLPASDPSSGA